MVYYFLGTDYMIHEANEEKIRQCAEKNEVGFVIASDEIKEETGQGKRSFLVSMKKFGASKTSHLIIKADTFGECSDAFHSRQDELCSYEDIRIREII